MKANELAVGDWVMPLRKSIRKPCRAITIDGGTNTCWIDSDEYSGLLPCSDLERIPLTPEILEKNGFKEIEGKRTSLGQSWVWHEKSEKVYGKYVEITLYDEAICGISSLVQIETCSQIGDGLNKLHSCDIQYVHQLQHALKLCGIDKEIVI